MDRATATQILELLKSLDAPLNQATDLADRISDVAERKSVRRAIGEIGARAYTDLIVPILRQHPDLDPDKARSIDDG